MKVLLKMTCILLLLLMAGHALNAQTSIVTGIIVDPEGTPLPGVTIRAAGATRGSITSIDGKYAIQDVMPSDTLVYSFVGYETAYRPVGNSKEINVIMKASTEQLDEVQVVAFQKQKKESVIGSINTIKPAELKLP
ncbi:MAG TPA: carboxypeptidase-like regulatory domain-containing protein, partial [Bacteroidales bacterium]|nr:carboxypeptidase-like regulatory domain-containing protein [Bacteroidales bacterium]